MIKLKSPLACVWEVTNRCNFTCPHCRAFSIAPKEDCNIEHRIIEQLVENEVLSVNLSGGEPLLNPRIFNIIQELTINGIDVGLSTNGFLFVENVEKLIRAGISFVQISIDGPKDFHNSFRGNDYAYDRAIEAIQVAKNAGLFVQMNTTITSKNICYLFDNIALAEELGVDRLFFRRVVSAGLAAHNNVIPDKTTYIHTLKALLEQKFEKKNSLTISIDDPIISVLDSTHYNDSSICCSAGITSLGIDSQGNVFPCIFLRHCIGNIMVKNLYDIWNESSVLIKLRNREINICGNCKYKYTCGGCRAQSGIFAKDAFCPLE